MSNMYYPVQIFKKPIGLKDSVRNQNIWSKQTTINSKEGSGNDGICLETKQFNALPGSRFFISGVPAALTNHSQQLHYDARNGRNMNTAQPEKRIR